MIVSVLCVAVFLLNVFGFDQYARILSLTMGLVIYALYVKPQGFFWQHTFAVLCVVFSRFDSWMSLALASASLLVLLALEVLIPPSCARLPVPRGMFSVGNAGNRFVR